jgi:DNA-binding CsgD family transcriptional regulator
MEPARFRALGSRASLRPPRRVNAHLTTPCYHASDKEGETVLADEIEASLVSADHAAAARLVAGRPWCDVPATAQIRRLAAAAYAIGGREREIALVADARLLRCSSAEAMRGYLATLAGETYAHDLLLAGVVLTWSGDRDGAFAYFDQATDRAFAERRFHVAVAARERHAHHALLFGEATVARAHAEEARKLAQVHGLGRWRLRTSARAASIALDAGDLDYARMALGEARGSADAGDLLTLFAPIGAELAIASIDSSALATWTSPRIYDAALAADEPAIAIAAASACLVANHLEPADVTMVARRALLLFDYATGAIDFLARAAEYAEPAEARAAVDSLRALPAPHRPYVDAHYHLAHAHLLSRSGEAEAAAMDAGEAARAFDRLRLPRWSNEAMRLLVRDERARSPRAERRKTPNSLTKREHQVTLLIRRGASNREVAATLGISEHTVERHVSSILSRLGLRSRWQIVDSLPVRVH